MNLEQVAENLLLGRTCDNCAHCAGALNGPMVCAQSGVVKRGYIPKVRTCPFWSDEAESILMPRPPAMPKIRPLAVPQKPYPNPNWKEVFKQWQEQQTPRKWVEEQNKQRGQRLVELDKTWKAWEALYNQTKGMRQE